MQAGGQQDPAPKQELLDVLSEEFAAIAQRDRLDGVIGQNRSIQAALNEASEAAQNASPPPDNPAAAAAKARRRRLYQIAYGLDFNALCLSGGGIRSAAISLGVSHWRTRLGASCSISSAGMPTPAARLI